jgi:D-alanyl-D-alanine carboxypeptidase
MRKFNELSNTCESNDKWHIGSNGKAFTAMLCAVLIDKKKISWDSTIKDIISLSRDSNEKYLNVTLKELLSHTGGFPADMSKHPVWTEAWKENNKKLRANTPKIQREKCLKVLLKTPPEVERGTHLYSNWDYVSIYTILLFHIYIYIKHRDII